MDTTQNIIALFKFLAENDLISTGIIVVSIYLSYKGIRTTIVANRDNLKDRETISYIMDRNKDDNFTKGLYTILQLDDDENTDIRKYAKKEHRSSEAAMAIRYVCNHYEYLSVGVLNNIYNEKMLKDSCKATTLKIHKVLEGYIQEVRSVRGKNTICEHFDNLAKRWGNT